MEGKGREDYEIFQKRPIPRSNTVKAMMLCRRIPVKIFQPKGTTAWVWFLAAKLRLLREL